MYAGAMLSLAANLPVFRLQARAAVELMERAWLLGDPARPRHLIEPLTNALAKTMAGAATGKALWSSWPASSRDARWARQISAVGWPLVWIEEYDVSPDNARLGTRHAAEERRAEVPSAAAPCPRGARLPRRSLGPGSRRGVRGDRPVRGDGAAHRPRLRLCDDGADRGRARARRRESQPREAFAADGASGLLLATRTPRLALGLLELGRGDAEAAIAELAPFERIVRDGEVGEPWLVQWSPDLIEACSHVGDVPRATDVLEAFELQAQATGRVSALAAAARCRGSWLRRGLRRGVRGRTGAARPRADAVRAGADRVAWRAPAAVGTPDRCAPSA